MCWVPHIQAQRIHSHIRLDTFLVSQQYLTTLQGFFYQGMSSSKSSLRVVGFVLLCDFFASSLALTVNDIAGAFSLAPSLRFQADTQNSTPFTFNSPVKSGWLSVSFLLFFQNCAPV